MVLTPHVSSLSDTLGALVDSGKDLNAEIEEVDTTQQEARLVEELAREAEIQPLDVSRPWRTDEEKARDPRNQKDKVPSPPNQLRPLKHAMTVRGHNRHEVAATVHHPLSAGTASSGWIKAHVPMETDVGLHTTTASMSPVGEEG